MPLWYNTIQAESRNLDCGSLAAAFSILWRFRSSPIHPIAPPLESMTYELQILQLLCFDIHTNCRGCVPQLYIVFGTVLPPIQEGSVSELVSISGRFWLRVKEWSSRRMRSAEKPERRRLR